MLPVFGFVCLFFVFWLLLACFVVVFLNPIDQGFFFCVPSYSSVVTFLVCEVFAYVAVFFFVCFCFVFFIK